jgi:ribosomal protein S18 acetylase RimI-like enzyme
MPRRGSRDRSGLAPHVSVQVRLKATAGADAAADRDFVQALGRRTVMSSVGSLRQTTEAAAATAFERLCEIVAGQSHVTLIAHQRGERLGFLLLLDELPDEVTLMDQGFVAYMAVEPKWQGTGVGRALLAAAEEEARRRGLPFMALMVTEENEPALRLYERAGYRTERQLLCKPL